MWPDGAQYEGEFKNGSKEGQGKLKYIDGSKFVGLFRNNEL